MSLKSSHTTDTLSRAHQTCDGEVVELISNFVGIDKLRVCRNIVLLNQILTSACMRSCMNIDMSGGGDCGWLGWGMSYN